MKIPPEAWNETFGGRLGMRYTSVRPGEAEASFEVRPEHTNPPGVCHGGALFAFADDTMGAAVQAVCPEGRSPTSTQANVHFVRAARPGDTLRACARVLAHGPRSALVEARVEDPGGRLVVFVTSQFRFITPRTPEA